MTEPKITPGFNDESAAARPDAMSAAEYDEAFAKMARDYFSGREASDPPKLFYVTGLPGSGKSTFVAKAKQGRPGLEDYVHVNFDDLRVYHPRYAEHVEKDPVNAAARIDTAVERLIGWLTEEAAKRHLNVLLDDAAMGGEITKMILSPFQKEGYGIEAAVVAVPSSIARQAVHLRFEENLAAAKEGAPVIPRWVNTEEQDNAPAALVETVETIAEEKLAGKITVLDRGGRMLYPQDGVSPGGAVKSETTRELNASEKADYRQKAERIAGFVNRRAKPAGSGPKTAPPAL